MSSTGTTPSEDLRNEVARIKKLLGLDINRLAIGSDIEGVITGGPFGAIDFTTNGVSPISFVNVSTSIGSSQTNAPGVPAQVTGLVVTPISNSQLNLAWTASGSPNIANYIVYRNSSSIAFPVPNSYNNTGLTAGTTYAYNVSAINTTGIEGPLSATVNGTTTGTSPPMLELHFNNDYLDTSPNAYPSSWLSAAGTNGFTTGQFGSSALINTPVTPGSGFKDGFQFVDADCPLLRMNTSVGFSFSCWIYPVDLTHAVGFRRFIIEKADDASNFWSISIDNAGVLYFFVTKAGITYKRQISGFVLNSWQHIGAVFNGTTNTVEVYRNGVAGVASVAAEASTPTPSNLFLCASWANPASTYYEGRLDELRYYQVVLTSTQINNLKNTNAP